MLQLVQPVQHVTMCERETGRHQTIFFRCGKPHNSAPWTRGPDTPVGGHTVNILDIGPPPTTHCTHCTQHANSRGRQLPPRFGKTNTTVGQEPGRGSSRMKQEHPLLLASPWYCGEGSSIHVSIFPGIRGLVSGNMEFHVSVFPGVRGATS